MPDECPISRKQFVQVIDRDSPYAGRIGQVDEAYWTNSRAGGKKPRWMVKVQFRRGHFPLCRCRNFTTSQLEVLED